MTPEHNHAGPSRRLAYRQGSVPRPAPRPGTPGPRSPEIVPNQRPVRAPGSTGQRRPSVRLFEGPAHQCRSGDAYERFPFTRPLTQRPRPRGLSTPESSRLTVNSRYSPTLCCNLSKTTEFYMTATEPKALSDAPVTHVRTFTASTRRAQVSETHTHDRAAGSPARARAARRSWGSSRAPWGVPTALEKGTTRSDLHSGGAALALWGEETEAQTEGSAVAREEVVGASTQTAGSSGSQRTFGGEPGRAAVLGAEVKRAGIRLRVTGWMLVPLPEAGTITRGAGLGWGINMPPPKEIQ